MPSPPSWLSDMANHLASLMHDVDVLSPIGCHYFHNHHKDEWEVTVFASSTEVVGGEWDGYHTPSKFCFDILRAFEIFDEIKVVAWQALPVSYEDELGPHISIEGLVEGHKVWVRILSESPESIEPGRRIQAYKSDLEEIW